MAWFLGNDLRDQASESSPLYLKESLLTLQLLQRVEKLVLF